jgi:hypothetical protein
MLTPDAVAGVRFACTPLRAVGPVGTGRWPRIRYSAHAMNPTTPPLSWICQTAVLLQISGDLTAKARDVQFQYVWPRLKSRELAALVTIIGTAKPAIAAR